MKTVLTFVLLCLISAPSFGQGTVTSLQNLQIRVNAKQFRMYGNRNMDVEGTPFYNENWQLGYIMINKNTQSGIVKLNYDGYKNRVIYLKMGNQ